MKKKVAYTLADCLTPLSIEVVHSIVFRLFYQKYMCFFKNVNVQHSLIPIITDCISFTVAGEFNNVSLR